MCKMTRRMMIWATIMLLGTGMTQAQTIYVATNGTHDVGSNFDSWERAATNIHDAVALANSLALNVIVTNGSYRLTNELAVTGAFTMQSVNGPSETTIYRDAAFGNFRIFSISNANALVAGFTVTNGYLNNLPGAGVNLIAGAVSNCVITLCAVINGYHGAVGISGGLMTHCVITNAIISTAYNRNCVVVNGASAILQDSVIVGNGTVGGTYVSERAPVYISGGGTVRRCRVYNNAANGQAGGVTVNNGRLENSLVYSNYNHGNNAGGVLIDGASGFLVNCTVSLNRKAGATTFSGVRRTSGSVANSIMYGNAGTSPGDNYSGDVSACTYSCAPELTSGTGNVAGNPLFVDAATFNFRLAAGSPALDTGTNLVSVTTDIDGTTRPLAADFRGIMRHDMGAYEKDGALGALEVGFLGESLSGLNSVTSVFTAAVAGTNTAITWWGWDFNGDGTNELAGADLATVTNIFGPGRYTVSVSVSNSVDETATATRSNYVLVVAPDIYVVAEGGGHKVPFASWTDAATNLNDAVDIALSGCTVHVSNGIHRVTKTVGLFSDITIQSVNGPAVTAVWRDSSTKFGLFDIRHAGAFVSGLTLTNGNTSGTGGSAIYMTAGTVSNLVVTRCLTEAGYAGSITMDGGLMTDSVVTNMTHWYPVLVLSGTAVVEDSLFTSSTAGEHGFMQIGSGALVRRCRFERLSGNTPYVRIAAGGALENSLVYKSAASGTYLGPAGGVYMMGGRMVNCTVTGCTRTGGTASGVYRTGGSITNSIIYGNGAGAPADNYDGDIAAVWNSCAPELTNSEQGNISQNPSFVSAGEGDLRLAVGSLCIDSGTNIWSSEDMDLDRYSRRIGTSVDMGAYEYDPSKAPFSVAFNVAPSVGVGSVTSVLSAVVVGSNTTVVSWEWDLNHDGTADLTGADLATVTNVYGLGQHSASLRVVNSINEVAAVTNLNHVLVVAPDIYVSPYGNHEIPYSSWIDAATNLNAAVDVALAGCTVHVTNGSYRINKKVDLFTGLTVVSENGPDHTTLWRDTNVAVFGMFDLRHADAVLSGFTITNGGIVARSVLHMTAGTVSNCVMTRNDLQWADRGMLVLSGGRLIRCIATNNFAFYGLGIFSGSATVEDCRFEGNTAGQYGFIQMSGGTIRRSTIASNTASYHTAGVHMSGGRLESCLVHGNTSSSVGGADGAGGVYITGGAMVNCTVAGNVKTGANAPTAGGVVRSGGSLTNCIVYGNTGTQTNNYSGSLSAVWYSCAPELTPDVQGNINGNPLFKDATAADFRLAPKSPCINTGTNQNWMQTAFDLDGEDRIRQKRVNMGSYETEQPPPGTLILLR